MKIKKIREILPPGAVAVVENGSNRFYLSGFESSAGLVLITTEEAFLLVDSRYFEAAKKRAEIDVAPIEDFDRMLGGIKTVLLEDSVSVGRLKEYKRKFENAEFDCDLLGERISCIRAKKSEAEKQRIKKALELTEAAFSYILKELSEGVSEREIKAKLNCFIEKNGGAPAFDTIVLSGANTSLPHGTAGERQFKKGDFILLDFGARLDGYASDMTRTVALGKPDSGQKEVYKAVENALGAAEDCAVAGISAKELDKSARSVIEAAGFGKSFLHALGHGVGIDVHERPTLSKKSAETLEPGMVFTLEPGVYLEGRFGVRIENMSDFKTLNTQKTELLIIE